MKKLLGYLIFTIVFSLLAAEVWAMDFKVRGRWMFGVSASDMNMIQHQRMANGKSVSKKYSDYIKGAQRLRTIFEAIASEDLAGGIELQMGTPTTHWGKANGPTGGAALGADGSDIIVLRRAWLEWTPPDMNIKTTMGIQGISLPYAAGGAAIMQTNVAGISVASKISDNIALSGFWARPLNDNFAGFGDDHRDANYLDNLDLFALTLPISWDGVKLTPWIMYGIKGRNVMNGYNGYNGSNNYRTVDGNLNFTFYPYPAINGRDNIGGTSKTYGNLFWTGLPIAIRAFEPWNLELDFAYGYVEGMGRYNAVKYGGDDYLTPISKRASTKREGWLLKGILEYAFDWGAPGVLGWYSSGDSSSPGNGSGRIPTIVGWGNFTSFMGDGDFHSWGLRDINSTYAGTYGIGLQVRDLCIINQDVKHNIRAVWWGGTNSPEMAKYMQTAYSWQNGIYQYDGPYMTTNDGLLEFNLNTNYKMYDNLDINLSLGYIVNNMDNDTWNKAGMHNTTFSRQDIWKANLVFEYNF